MAIIDNTINAKKSRRKYLGRIKKLGSPPEGIGLFEWTIFEGNLKRILADRIKGIDRIDNGLVQIEKEIALVPDECTMAQCHLRSIRTQRLADRDSRKESLKELIQAHFPKYAEEASSL